MIPGCVPSVAAGGRGEGRDETAGQGGAAEPAVTADRLQSLEDRREHSLQSLVCCVPL